MRKAEQVNHPGHYGGADNPRMHHYEVMVQGFGPRPFAALSAGKARAEAWREFSQPYPDCTFGDFLKISSVRRINAPEDDGYNYVRTAYGISVKIGQRVRLVKEGPSTGLEGEVVYPNRPCTCYVHVLIDGRDHAVCVHPMNAETVERVDD